MINILLTSKDDEFIKLKVYGHSMYDISGRDIVCAAVSIMVQSVIVGLKEVISSNFEYSIDEKHAYVMVDISRYDDDNKGKAQILFRTFKCTIDKLLLDYKKYIEMNVEEE